MGHRVKWKAQKFLKPLETFMLLEDNIRENFCDLGLVKISKRSQKHDS